MAMALITPDNSALVGSVAVLGIVLILLHWWWTHVR